jgi:hypothetical protein
MKLLFVSLALVFGFFLFNSCHERGPLFPDPALGLGLRDFSCTEAWIEVQVGNNDKTANIYIKKDDDIIKTITLGQSDSIFYFDNLQPNTSYKFDAVTYDDGKEIKSNPVTFTTLDTTSHNFSWQTFEFGQHGSSKLYDVTVINENNIWAVGEIYMNDSQGNPDPIKYNAIHWNGIEWELKRVQTLFNGNIITVSLEGLFAFTETDIWMVGSLPIHGNGTNWTMFDIRTTVDPNLSLSKAWGSSPNDIFFIGRTGSIARYQNGIWTKLESGTTSIINDAWGFLNEQNKPIIYCPVASFFTVNDKKILKIIDGKVDSVNWNRDVRLYSAWAQNENLLYVCGEGVFVNKFGIWNEIMLQPVGTNSVRGNNINDIFVVGDYGSIFHFNGVSWQILSSFNDKGYSKVFVENDIVAICGRHLGRALIEIGRRN